MWGCLRPLPGNKPTFLRRMGLKVFFLLIHGWVISPLLPSGPSQFQDQDHLSLSPDQSKSNLFLNPDQKGSFGHFFRNINKIPVWCCWVETDVSFHHYLWQTDFVCFLFHLQTTRVMITQDRSTAFYYNHVNYTNAQILSMQPHCANHDVPAHIWLYKCEYFKGESSSKSN